MKKLLLLLTLLSPLGALAQTTSVTATVTDPNGTTYANGTWKASFVNRLGFTGTPLLNGSSFTMTYNGTTDSTGTFTVGLADLSQVSPLQSSWRFIICSASSGTCFESVRNEVVGGSVNLSSQLSAVAPVIAGVAFASIRFGPTETPAQIWAASGQSSPLLFMKTAKGITLWQFSSLGITFPDGTFQSTAGGIGGAVVSWNSRTGSVLPTSGDYNFNQLAGSLAIGQTPLTTAGDILFANTTPALARLAVGANGQYLGVASGLPTYLNFPLVSGLGGSITLSQTPLTTRGDLLTVNASGLLARLALGTNGQCLTSNGSDVNWLSCATAGSLLITDNIWTLSQRFKGPVPWHDVTAYLASGSNVTGTASITSGTTTITLGAVGDWKNGQGVYLLGCNGNYATSIVSGAGTTTLIVADPAPCTITSNTIFHDDQVPIQNAFNDSVIDHGKVFCPPGNYNIMRAPLAVLGGQFLFQGSGQNSCKLLYPSQGAASLATGFVVTPTVSAYVTTLCAALLTGTGGSYCPGTGQTTWFDLRDANASGQINALAAFTAEVTFRLANLTTTQTILSSGGKRDSLTSAEAFELTANSNGSLTCALNIAGTLRTITGATGAIVAATTYHAAVSYDGSNIRCFLNGTQVTGSPFATTGTVTQQDYEMVQVGMLAIGGDFPEGAGSQPVTSTGQIDALRLSQNARYTANFTAPTAKFGASDANTLIQVNWDNTLTVFQGGTTGAFQFPVYLVQHKTCPASSNFVMKDLTIGAGAYFSTGGSDARVENVTFGGGTSGALTVANCSFANRFTNVDFGGNRWAFASMSGLSRLTGLKNLGGSQPYPFILAPPAGNLDSLFLNVTQGQKIGVLAKPAGAGSPNLTVNNFFVDAESAVTGYTANILVDQIDSFIMTGGTSDVTAMACTTNCWNVIVQETNHQTTAQFSGTVFSQASGQDAIIHHVLNSNNLNPIVLNTTLRSQPTVRWSDQPGHLYWSEPLVNTVTFSATPVFDCTKGPVQKITLTANVTSSMLIGCVPGQTGAIEVNQDATGGRTFVAPTNTVNFPTVASGANAQTLFLFVMDTTNAIAPVTGGGSGIPCTVTALSLQFNNAGAFGCTSATYTAGTGTFNFTQLANGNTLLKLKRFTDTSPTGNLFTLRDAADTTDLARLDATANYLGASYVSNGPGTGFLDLTQGASQTTAACHTGANCILHQAPTAVTAHMVTWPGVAAKGILRGNISGSGATLTETISYDADLKTCNIIVGADNGSAIVDLDLGPQRKICQIPFAATVTEIDIASDAGTPNVIVAKRHCTASPCSAANETRTNLTSSALATGASGATGCSNTGGTTGFDTFTTCANTLQNTALAVGDWIELTSGTAGGVAVRMSIAVHITR